MKFVPNVEILMTPHVQQKLFVALQTNVRNVKKGKLNSVSLKYQHVTEDGVASAVKAQQQPTVPFQDIKPVQMVGAQMIKANCH